MTTRCLSAFDYADYRAQNVLRKHAKKRPLGDIESKHRYRPAQPVLSCRTVDVDLSGTRTYRAKSTTDIISEQHRYIHELYSKARSIASAPPRRHQSASRYNTSDNIHKLQRINIEVSGRPLSSLSQNPKLQHKKKVPSAKRVRPKTTGHIKSSKSANESYMVVKVDPDLLETSRSQREITDQIHQHWLPENNNLNQGRFIKGQKKPESVPTSIDAWLTFGGAPGDADNGVVDAFASYRSEEEYYNIDGSVGSKVAQQLQRGDKIRIGINGVIQSHDLKVRKKSGVSRYESPLIEERKEEEKKEEGKNEEGMNTEEEDMEKGEEEEFDFMAGLNSNLMTEDIDHLIDMDSADDTKHTPVIPLSWDDQIQKDGVKVLSPRCVPVRRETTNLCETQPVVFEKLVPEETSPGRPWAPRTDGYQVKYRQRPQLHGLDSKESRLNRVKVISIDPRSQEDEDKLNSISVDEILKTAVEKKSTTGNRTSEKIRKELRKEEDEGSRLVKQNSSGSPVETGTPQSGEHPRKRLSVQSQAPSTTVQELSIVSPGLKHKAAEKTAKNSGKAMTGKGLIRSPLGSSGPSIKTGVSQGETEYIQIASQLRVPGNSGQRTVMSYSHQTQDRLSPERPYSKASPRGERDKQVEEESLLEEPEGGGAAPSLASPETKSPVPALEISIPTAEEGSDRDSLLPSPQRRASFPDEADELTNRQKREANMRDAQIDQIASMLGSALIRQ